MPADASIYSLIRPQAAAPGPLDQYGQAMQLKNLMGQGDLQALQVQQARQAIADDEGTRQFYSGLKPGEDPRTRISDLLRVNPKAGMAAQKYYQESDKTQAEIDAKRFETHKKSMEMVGGAFANLAQNPTHEGVVRTLDTLRSSGAIQDAGYQKLFKDIPTDPALLPQYVNNVVTMTEHGLSTLKARAPDVQMVDSGQTITPFNKNALAGPIAPVAGGTVTQKVQTPDSVASNKLGYANLAETKAEHGRVAARDAAARNTPNLQHVEGADGMMTFNPKTGKYEQARDASGKPIEGKKEPTESQSKAAGFLSRATRAHEILNTLADEGDLVPGSIKTSVEGFPLVGGPLGTAVNALPGFLGGPSGAQQRVEQAQRDFVNAVLRPESGATIQKDEFDNARKQYFPQRGDTDEVIAQKKAAREAELETLKIMAGKPGQKVIEGRPKIPAVPPKPTQAEIDAELRRRKVIP